MDKLKRYECSGDHNGIAGYYDKIHDWHEIREICLPSDVEALEAENERLKSQILLAIKHLEKFKGTNALGSGYRDDCGEWSIVDELIHNLSRVMSGK